MCPPECENLVRIALGLRPGTSEPDGILEYVRGDRSGLCALYERSKAVPLTRTDGS